MTILCWLEVGIFHVSMFKDVNIARHPQGISVGWGSPRPRKEAKEKARQEAKDRPSSHAEFPVFSLCCFFWVGKASKYVGGGADDHLDHDDHDDHDVHDDHGDHGGHGDDM